jgi:hypothetical protein
MMTGMGKRVVKELRYDAPIGEVTAMLADPAFREQVLADQQVLSGSAEVTEGTVRIEQVQSAEGLPSFATKIVGHEIRILQQETWATPDNAHVHVSLPGRPGEIEGTIELVERDGSTIEKVDLEINVRMPLIGSKVEGLVAGLLEKALDKEYATGVAWLASH